MPGRPKVRLVAALVAVVPPATVVAVGAIGCGAQSASHRQSAATLRVKQIGGARSCSDVAAQARLDTFVLVAKRIYGQEHAPVVGRVVAKKLSQNAALLRAVKAGDLARVRSEARRPVITHEVRVRIVRGSRVLMDAGLPFVVQAAVGELRGPSGSNLGRVEVSIQDVIGFVKLVRRETDTEVLVRGQRGRVATSLPGAAHVQVPASGKVTVGGRTYLARSFKEVDFVGKPLSVWILDPGRVEPLGPVCRPHRRSLSSQRRRRASRS
jgi:hypothetical protein